mmetsp:Transcript_66757/g.198652  ORF Transcript_66757/g.198652 Transcript_66757/m.198652 type:complete len:246 (+) Transcript_66757:299-1036(+)
MNRCLASTSGQTNWQMAEQCPSSQIGTVCSMPSGTGRSDIASYMESSNCVREYEAATCVLLTWPTTPRSPSLATRNNRLGAVAWAVEGGSTGPFRRMEPTPGSFDISDRELKEDRDAALLERRLRTCRATACALKSFWRPVSSACSSSPGSAQGRCSARICSSTSFRLVLARFPPLASQTSDTSLATRPMRRKTSASKSASKRGCSNLFMACKTMTTLLLLPDRMIGTQSMLRTGPTPPESQASQ